MRYWRWPKSAGTSRSWATTKKCCWRSSMARFRRMIGCGLAAWPRSSPYGRRPGSTEGPEALLAAILPEHIAFFRSCRDYHETDTHLLLHANYDPARPLAEQDRLTIRWRSLRESIPAAHCSGKTAILGHTPTRSGEIFDIGYLKCLDTYCFGGGWLTALDLASGQIWQADRNGCLRAARG